jgi:hypothetical protein
LSARGGRQQQWRFLQRHDIDHDNNHPSPVVVDVFVIGCRRLCCARLTTAVGRRRGSGRRQGSEDGDRDKRDGATCCDNDDNHPYPVVANVVIIWRLYLCGDGMTTAAAGQQQGGKEGAVDAMVQLWWGGEVNKSSILVHIYLTESLL